MTVDWLIFSVLYYETNACSSNYLNQQFLSSQLVHKKLIYRGELPKKGGLGQFLDLKGGLAKKRRVVFLRGADTQNAHHELYKLCINNTNS